MIVRTEPLHWITDFEPNYLAFVEFYDEDFAWRYTPAAPKNDDPLSNKHSKLRPWICLLILKEIEFERTGRRLPLPSINVRSASVFPPAEETWLWAHVHSNANIPNDELSTYERFLQSLNNTLNDDPDQLYCRLMSPRQLEPSTEYFAFVVPAFETGRLAGLEQPSNDINAQLPSWSAAGANGEMPVYFEWQFRTGVQADFESMIKLLVPREVDPRVGVRDMDCSDPGFVKAGGGRFPPAAPPVLGLEGALKSPKMVSTIFPAASPNAFQTELQELVNLPAKIIGTHESGDPIISVPMYGGKHAKISPSDVVLLDVANDNWVNDLNRDPRTRVPAGVGTCVIQKNQESYMRKAWQQVDKILAANRRIRLTKIYMTVALQYAKKTIAALPSNVLLAISKPLHKRVMGSPETIHQQIKQSTLPAASLTSAFRRIIRPNGKVVQKMTNSRKFPYNTLISALNDNNIKPAPPKKIPAGTPNTKNLADKISRAVLVGRLIARAATIPLSRRIRNNAAKERLLDPVKELDHLARIAPNPRFNVTLDDERITPPATPVDGGRDSMEGRNFRLALTDLDTRLSAKAPDTTVLPLTIATASQKVAEAIDPLKAYPLKLSATVILPGGIDTTKPENIFPVIAYPDFEDPMYKGLTSISDELLLPNLQLVPNNTISILKTNSKFIEAYMVGLNNEMGRELLWREFPTDERGSYFRQFWDVKGLIRPSPATPSAQLAEEYKDIEPIHTWDRTSKLGTHNKRISSGQPEQLVLLIRGDLLKRYPNTVIMAQKAIPDPLGLDPIIDTDLNEIEFNTQVKFPLYKAEILPDIKFFGFDLTIDQAKGTATSPGFPDDLGWFFIIQQMPGEPRFGMDINSTGNPATSWDDLAWDQFGSTIPFIKGAVKPSIDPEPESAKWGTDAAEMAYILFQKPSMVAVHAKDMLENVKA